MKKNLIAALSTVLAGMFDAYGLTQCVRISAETACTTSSDCYYTSNCSLDCDGIAIDVIARCSSSTGTVDVTTATNLSISTTSTANKYCWCMLVSPATSKWVYRAAYSGTAACSQWCGRGCRNGFMFSGDTDITFRNTLFSNLTD